MRTLHFTGAQISARGNDGTWQVCGTIDEVKTASTNLNEEDQTFTIRCPLVQGDAVKIMLNKEEGTLQVAEMKIYALELDPSKFKYVINISITSTQVIRGSSDNKSGSGGTK